MILRSRERELNEDASIAFHWYEDGHSNHLVCDISRVVSLQCRMPGTLVFGVWTRRMKVWKSGGNVFGVCGFLALAIPCNDDHPETLRRPTKPRTRLSTSCRTDPSLGLEMNVVRVREGETERRYKGEGEGDKEDSEMQIPSMEECRF
jgi:hypothetical protein